MGESGSGKSVTALSIMGLNAPSIKYSKDSVISYKGENLLNMKKKQLKKIRGNEISMIFQDPMSSSILFIRLVNKLQNRFRFIRESVIKQRKKPSSICYPRSGFLIQKIDYATIHINCLEECGKES